MDLMAKAASILLLAMKPMLPRAAVKPSRAGRLLPAAASLHSRSRSRSRNSSRSSKVKLLK